MAIPGFRHLVVLTLGVAILVAACAPAAPAPAPTAAPGAPKPAATTAPAAPAAPTTAAAQPAKPPAQVIDIRAASTASADALVSRSLTKWAELVGQKTNGEVKVNVFYGTMGGDQQLHPAAMSGSIDVGIASTSNTAQVSDAFYLLDLPFLYKTYDNLMKSVATPLLQPMIAKYQKDTGLKLMFFMAYGSGRDIQTRNKLLKVPADIKGLKIRAVSTPVDLATIKAWGANPTPVEWAQVYPALQQGVVDGEDVPVSLVVSEKHYEIVKYAIRLDYQMILQIAYMNQKKFDSLSPAHQKAFLDAAKEAQDWTTKTAAAEVDSGLEKLKGLGMEYYKPTPDEYNQWASIREPLWQELAAGQLKGKFELDQANQIYKAQ